MTIILLACAASVAATGALLAALRAGRHADEAMQRGQLAYAGPRPAAAADGTQRGPFRSPRSQSVPLP